MGETICAISTGVGTGAISIIRVSGNESIKIVNSIFSHGNLHKVKSHTINYGYIKEEEKNIDEVLVTVMKAPKTFTGEDTVEINCHGGIAPTNKILEMLLNNGCKLAEPGEFTKRAYLNGKIDLLKAEAISDIISSETEKARKLAINQISGGLSSKIEIIRKKLIETLAHLEVNIDYPEYEDIEVITNDILKPELTKIKEGIEVLIKEADNGKIIKNGIDVAIIGQPNVGKSSILNSFLEEEKAIVTNIPGTTRDVIEGRFSLNGILLNLVDTAGIRETSDIVEQLGVKKSLEAQKKADLVIYVIDNSTTNLQEDIKKIEKYNNNNNIIVFINKDDIKSNNDYSALNKYNLVKGNTLIPNGLNDLKNKISELFSLNELETKDYSYLSSARHTSLAKEAKNVIEMALNNLEMNIPLDLITIDIKNCYELLGEIIGKIYKEDLLDELFSKFCLGK